MKRYNPKEIEPKWQQTWAESKIYEAQDQSEKPKKYVLEYFPYPSGAAMHVGHVRNYTIGDVIARHARMSGYNVLHPMGWDAFGLPAENYAIKNGISPQEAIKENTTKFKRQLMQMGFSYDWSREINSSDPEYYRWTQWFFLLLHKRGLAYQKESLQWWCPIDKTVLANEQVENGQCWRCGSQVEKKALKQWFFKITEYADRLEKDLDDVNWSDALKNMQRNWIGHKTGINITYDVTNVKTKVAVSYVMGVENIEDELKAIGADVVDRTEEGHFKVTFPADKAADFEKLIVDKIKPGFWNEYIAEETVYNFKHHDGHVERLVLSSETEPHIRKLGNQFNNNDDDSRPVQNWINNNAFYRDYQPGAITCFTTRPDTNFGATFVVLAPEHQFVQKAMRQEIMPSEGSSHWQAIEHYVQKSLSKSDLERQEEGRLKTGVFTGFYARNQLTGEDMPIWVSDFVLSGFGTGAVVGVPGHDIRDFQFAQTFDIPVKRVVAGRDGDESPIVKPEQVQEEAGIMVNSDFLNGMEIHAATEKIKDYLEEHAMGTRVHSYHLRDWLISRQRYWGAPIPMIHCEKCGTVPVPEGQLPVKLPEMKTFEPSGDGRSPLARVPEFVNTTCPKCGGPAERETDTMDGFACSSWYFLRYADPHNQQRAFDDAKAKYWMPVDDYIGGAEHAVMHLLYTRFWFKVMQDEGLIDFGEPIKTLRNHGMILAPDGQKMSKSKGNTIEPDGLIEQGYGADAIRIMELFIGPWNQSANWSVEGMGGSFRFLQRVWTLSQDVISTEDGQDKADATEIRRITHRTIKKVSQDLQNLNFNTAIAAMMEAVNAYYAEKTKTPFSQAPATWRWACATLAKLLAPFAPHITEELWSQMGNQGSIHTAEWPEFDEKYLTQDTLTVVVQINGKVRAQIEVPADAKEEQVIETAKANQKAAAHLSGKELKKTIYVPGKLVSFVV